MELKSLVVCILKWLIVEICIVIHFDSILVLFSCSPFLRILLAISLSRFAYHDDARFRWLFFFGYSTFWRVVKYCVKNCKRHNIIIVQIIRLAVWLGCISNCGEDTTTTTTAAAMKSSASFCASWFFSAISLQHLAEKGLATAAPFTTQTLLMTTKWDNKSHQHQHIQASWIINSSFQRDFDCHFYHSKMMKIALVIQMKQLFFVVRGL